MHGNITLDSVLGSGTKATFSIPFNKPEFNSGPSAFINLDSIPDRLQSEMSVSACGSDLERSNGSPPGSPIKPYRNRSRNDSGSVSPRPLASKPDLQPQILDDDRINRHILVVEDKSVFFQCFPNLTLILY